MSVLELLLDCCVVVGVLWSEADLRWALAVNFVLDVHGRGHHSTRQARKDPDDGLVFSSQVLDVLLSIVLSSIQVMKTTRISLLLRLPSMLFLLFGGLTLRKRLHLLLPHFALGQLTLKHVVAPVDNGVVPHLFDLAASRCAERLRHKIQIDVWIVPRHAGAMLKNVLLSYILIIRADLVLGAWEIAHAPDADAHFRDGCYLPMDA